MNLLVARVQRTRVIDQRSAQHVGIGQTALRVALDEGAAIGRQLLAQGDVRRTVILATHSPGLERVDVRRRFSTTRELATGLAPVFNVDAEEDRLRTPVTLSIGLDAGPEKAHAREDDGVGRRWTRFRPADLVIVRVAQIPDQPARVRILAARQAGALQGIENALGVLEWKLSTST